MARAKGWERRKRSGSWRTSLPASASTSSRTWMLRRPSMLTAPGSRAIRQPCLFLLNPAARLAGQGRRRSTGTRPDRCLLGSDSYAHMCAGTHVCRQEGAQAISRVELTAWFLPVPRQRRTSACHAWRRPGVPLRMCTCAHPCEHGKVNSPQPRSSMPPVRSGWTSRNGSAFSIMRLRHLVLETTFPDGKTQSEIDRRPVSQQPSRQHLHTSRSHTVELSFVPGLYPGWAAPGWNADARLPCAAQPGSCRVSPRPAPPQPQGLAIAPEHLPWSREARCRGTGARSGWILNA